MTATENEPIRRVIGSLAPDPRQPGSVRVMVQGRPLLTIPRSVAEDERLGAGVLLDEARYARLCRAADLEAACHTALRYLERRPFAAHDLERRLVLKGHPPEAAAGAVARATHAGLVDDARFARHFIDTRGARGRGPLRLRRDLAALGVDRAVVDAALAAALGPGGSDLPSVETLARKRLAQLGKLPAPVLRRRLLGFLGRRGYGGADVNALVSRLSGNR